VPRGRLGLGRRVGRGQLGPKLLDLVREVSEGARGVRVLEPDASGPSLHLLRVDERGQRLGHVVEHALASFLLRLELLPALFDRPGRRRLGLGEDVRMAADELLANRPRDGGEVARASLLEEEGQEDRLEEEVAELVQELLVVARERGVSDLVGLLDSVRDDRERALRAVPGAVAAKALGELLQVDELACELVGRRQRYSSEVTDGVVSVPVPVSVLGGSKPAA